MRTLIARMDERAVDALAQAVQAVARGDVEAGERTVRDANSVNPMLDRVMQAVTQAPSGPTMRAWSAAAVLVARHIERVANNAAEIGARVRFLVTGETAPIRGGTSRNGDQGVAIRRPQTPFCSMRQQNRVRSFPRLTLTH